MFSYALLKPYLMQDSYIAMIDDDEDDVAILKDCFEKYHSISIKSFPSGQKFLNSDFNESLPCLIVLDLNLYDIRGTDFIERIRANSSIAHVPVIVYTADYSLRDKVNCDDLQIQLLHKPATFLEWDHIAALMAQNCEQAV